jgi:hypothetical protein
MDDDDDVIVPDTVTKLDDLTIVPSGVFWSVSRGHTDRETNSHGTAIPAPTLPLSKT